MQGDPLINICYKNKLSFGKGQCGENSHGFNSLKVIHISNLEEWIPLDSCWNRRRLSRWVQMLLTLQNCYTSQDSWRPVWWNKFVLLAKAKSPQSCCLRWRAADIRSAGQPWFHHCQTERRRESFSIGILVYACSFKVYWPEQSDTSLGRKKRRQNQTIESTT